MVVNAQEACEGLALQVLRSLGKTPIDHYQLNSSECTIHRCLKPEEDCMLATSGVCNLAVSSARVPCAPLL